MRRRDFIKGIAGSAAAWPLAARAQQPALPVIGFVNSASPGGYPPVSAFLKGLNESGLVEGRDYTIEYRWAQGQYERLPALLDDLIQRKVNVIAATSTPAAVAAKATNTSIPIVFTTSGDPIKLGLVTSLSQPGGNLTGATQLNVEVAPKRLQLIHEAIPTAANIALLVNSPDPMTAPTAQELKAAAAALGLNLQIVNAGVEQDLPKVFETLLQLRAEALVIGSDPFFSNVSKELAALSVRYKVPAIYQYPEFTAAGGFMSYGGNVSESYRLAGIYAGRIVKGEKPANLPVQEVNKVELIINMKTAKALGISVPLSLFGRADEVIE
jgi:putative ABC transport system substrate-binding protein